MHTTTWEGAQSDFIFKSRVVKPDCMPNELKLEQAGK